MKKIFKVMASIFILLLFIATDMDGTLVNYIVFYKERELLRLAVPFAKSL